MYESAPNAVLERRWGLCAPTDALADDLDEALRLLRDFGLECCELRTVGGTPVSDMPTWQQQETGLHLRDRGCAAVLLDTDVGAAPLADPFWPHWSAFQRALESAATIAAPAVRIFSFEVREAELDAARAEVRERCARMAEAAQAHGLTLLVENRPGTYACSGARLGDLLEGVNSPALGALFNPAAFVARREHPFLTAFMVTPAKSYTRCVRVRDARFEDGQPVLPNQGNGELRELVSALAARSFDGFYSLDPGIAGGAASFGVALGAFETIVETLLGVARDETG
jgi:sugar phosphate isomerase/epimerase